MPCYERRTISVNLEAADLAALAAAVEAATGELVEPTSYGLIWSTGRYRQGVLECLPEQIGAIRRGYTAEVAVRTAKRFGWSAKRTSANKVTFAKRSY